MRDGWQFQLRTAPFKNTSGQLIPPFAAMELDYDAEGGKSALELVASEDAVWHCKQPSSSTKPQRTVFNSVKPVASGGYGSFQLDPVALALADLSTALSPNDECGPVDGSWYLQKAGKGFAFMSLDTARAHYVSSTVRTVVVRPLPAVTRRQWLGYLMETFRGTTIGFWVVPALALDGVLPSGFQYAYNIFKWDFGVIGATVQVQEDIANARWLGLQMEYICDDGRTVAPQTPPP